MIVLLVLFGMAALALLAHGLFSLWLMIQAWNDPQRLRSTAGPASFADPELSFSVIVPAREEESVIAQTMLRLWQANYPRQLLEIIVVCQQDDPATIAAVSDQIEALSSPRIIDCEQDDAGSGQDDGDASAAVPDQLEALLTPRVHLAVYDNPPFNKPHALSVGYEASSNDVVMIFDAEDDVHPDIFNLINTVMAEQSAGVVQGGVQLMNFRDHWFAAFNCVEYFFYFRSRMHFNARVGMVPLGGNTIAIRRELIDRAGGWDIGCLTEDADIGVRLSALGERIHVVYDSRCVTREETPHSVKALVRQRTRWSQGFLQVLFKGHWRRIPGRRRQALALITFGQPLLDALLVCMLPLIPLAILLLKLPVLLAIFSLAPLYVVALQMLAGVLGMIEFGRLFGERVPRRLLLRMPFVYIPFQALVGFSALRAIARNARGLGEWEKTEHRGAHRVPIPLPQATVATGAPGSQ